MFSHLLVPVDGTGLSWRGVLASLELAKKLEARVTGFVVMPPTPVSAMNVNPSGFKQEVQAHQTRTEAHAQEILADFAAEAAKAGVPFDGRTERTDSIDGAIAEAVQKYGCDLIVMATQGRGGFGEMLFGSHTKNVMARCTTPLLVLR
ncbi:MAG TPA: universal stress protein [Rubrivivax sp.]|nr:universal stress protein [Burkholderiales bacterium]HNT39545.1 universal stress protein [Rubrivivax sp.]